MKDLTDPYVKMMFGNQAKQAGFNYIVQGAADDNKAAIIGNTAFANLMSFDGIKKATHTLVLCDVIIRPHLVIASKHLLGNGAASLLTSSALSSLDEWLEKGEIIIDNLSKGL